MGRQLVRAPGHDRSRSLGWLAVAWMEFFCVHGPGPIPGEKVRLTDEYTGFVADCYALSPEGRMMYDSAFLSRPKGTDKSGQGARFALFEALGPCRFAGWAEGGELYEDPWDLGFVYEYDAGEPMGKHLSTPYVRVMATEEGQAGNVYDVIHFNLIDDSSPLSQIPGLDVGLTRTILPGGGEITPSTASSASKDGGKETFVDFDESHLYNTPELRAMYATVTRNMRKRKREGTWYLETTTMFAQGEDSIAEQSYKLAAEIEENRRARARHLSDHRWGDCENTEDLDGLRAAITEAYGDAIAFNDLEGIIDEFNDPRASMEDSRRYFLNSPTHPTNAWIAHFEWDARQDRSKALSASDAICLGFDGSRKRSRGVTDATALIGCRVSDGHLFEIRVWEQPLGAAGSGWEVPFSEVDREVTNWLSKPNVVGFYGDPARWESYFAKWEAQFGKKVKVGVTREHPFMFWMTGGRAVKTVQALEQFLSAVLDGHLTHDGSSALARHITNARRRVGRDASRYGLQIAKASPDSPYKIDAAVAAVLAWQARLDAVAKGVGRVKRTKVGRIR